jgi:archaellum component FlaC
MSSDNIQSQIEFILEHQAKFSEDISQLREAIGELKDVQKQQGENIDRLTADVQLLAQAVEINRAETREAIDNLIISNEVTRKLAEDVARLAIQTNQRVTGLDQRLIDIESKQ